MSAIKLYEVVSSTKLEEFKKMVRDKLAEGWDFQGELSTANILGNTAGTDRRGYAVITTFTQAFVKLDIPPPMPPDASQATHAKKLQLEL